MRWGKREKEEEEYDKDSMSNAEGETIALCPPLLCSALLCFGFGFGLPYRLTARSLQAEARRDGITGKQLEVASPSGRKGESPGFCYFGEECEQVSSDKDKEKRSAEEKCWKC